MANLINSGLTDLKKEIKKISEDEIKIEKTHKIVDIIEKILEFNQQIEKGHGLKIFMPS